MRSFGDFTTINLPKVNFFSLFWQKYCISRKTHNSSRNFAIGHTVPQIIKKEPVILNIDTEAAQKAGIQFYIGNDKVWLCNRVPKECITV